MNRISRFLAFVCLAFPIVALAQNAQLSGVVKDKTGAMVPHAEVTLTNTETAAVLHSKTSNVGFFIFSSVQPGRYSLTAEAAGFDKTLIQNVKVDVAANVSLDMILQIKQGAEQITVAGNAQLNDTDGTVSTVISHELIENMPLNGDDLQTLFELTPGTILNASGSPSEGGGFSVDGQRATSNYTMVDGVSANAYVPSTGGLPNVLGSGIATSASGGTNGILPVDAIEEYRMDTSTYTAENGRTPGGQIQIRTRSGTNLLHGTLFDEFRNQLLDANDWFSNYDNIPQAQLRMNEFGGTVGGPVVIPRLFDGRNRLFFFVSNENLILDQPNTQSKLKVPDASILSGAASVFQPLLAVFPTGNGGQVPNIPSFDYFNHSYPDLIRDYTTSVRLDAQLSRSMHAFVRANIAPSNASEDTGVSELQQSVIGIDSYTAGLTSTIGARISNELTGNYTTDNTRNQAIVPSLEGNNPGALTNNLPSGVNASSDDFMFVLETPNGSAGAQSTAQVGPDARNRLEMFNIVDTVGWHIGKNTMKAGVDYLKRNTTLRAFVNDYDAAVTVSAAPPYNSSDLDKGIMALFEASHANANPSISSNNLSLFVTDDWKATSSVTLNAGIRWELNPAPAIGPLGVLTFEGANMSLATFQTTLSTKPLYRTVYSNFAPRFGFAWIPRGRSGTAVRGGAGIYFDTGQAATAIGAEAGTYPYFSTLESFGVPYASVNWANPGVTAATKPISDFYLVSPTLMSPRTYEWSLSLDQTLSKSTKLTMSYVGNDGEKLVGQEEYYNAQNNQGQYPLPITTVQKNGYFYLTTNQGHSNYQALQAQLTSQVGQRFSALVSYTWEHAEDNGSNDFASVSASIPNIPMANSDLDIPQMFATAIHYAPQAISKSRVLRAVTGEWAFDTIARLQSAAPLTVFFSSQNLNELIYGFSDNANVVPGVPTVVHEHISSGTVVPGNKLLNWAAFTAPPTNTSGVQTSNGNSPTNGYRLFGLKQWDVAASRSWKIWEGLSLNFRVDAFNLLNIANFSAVDAAWAASDSATFGRAQDTYAAAYGGNIAGDGTSGEQLAVFQNGGPRELQLSIKLKF